MHPQSSRRGTLQTSKYGCGHSFLKKKKKKLLCAFFMMTELLMKSSKSNLILGK